MHSLAFTLIGLQIIRHIQEHFYIVWTQIDMQTGKKIKDNFEKGRAQKFIKEFEQTYLLDNDDPKEKINLKFTATCKIWSRILKTFSLNSSGCILLPVNECIMMPCSCFIMKLVWFKRHFAFITDGMVIHSNSMVMLIYYGWCPITMKRSDLKMGSI